VSSLCDVFNSVAPVRETGYNEFGTCVPKIHPAKFSWVLDTIKAQSEAKAAAAAAAKKRPGAASKGSPDASAVVAGATRGAGGAGGSSATASRRDFSILRSRRANSTRDSTASEASEASAGHDRGHEFKSDDDSASDYSTDRLKAPRRLWGVRRKEDASLARPPPSSPPPKAPPKAPPEASPKASPKASSGLESGRPSPPLPPNGRLSPPLPSFLSRSSSLASTVAPPPPPPLPAAAVSSRGGERPVVLAVSAAPSASASREPSPLTPTAGSTGAGFKAKDVARPPTRPASAAAPVRSESRFRFSRMASGVPPAASPADGGTAVPPLGSKLK